MKGIRAMSISNHEEALQKALGDNRALRAKLTELESRLAKPIENPGTDRTAADDDLPSKEGEKPSPDASASLDPPERAAVPGSLFLANELLAEIATTDVPAAREVLIGLLTDDPSLDVAAARRILEDEIPELLPAPVGGGSGSRPPRMLKRAEPEPAVEVPGFRRIPGTRDGWMRDPRGAEAK
jgi:hypothetical protein